MIKQARKASRTGGKSVKGIKGRSVISSLPGLDLGTCMIPEYMHSVLLGVVKQFLLLWTNKKREDFSLNADLDEIDKILLKIKPPSDTHVIPRSIKLHAKHFKASELYYWLLFYSIPILKKFLPEAHFNHWTTLVAAIYILLQRKIQKLDIDKAESLLKDFVRKIESLYDIKQLTYNVHQLLHLAECTRRWGPLWANSAFVFESTNGYIASLVHGTKNLGAEIVKNLNIVTGLKILKSRTLKHNIRYDGRLVLHSTLGAKVKMTQQKKRIIGFKTITSIDNYFAETMNWNEVAFYYRAKIFNKMFTSEIYKENKTNNFNVEISTVDDVYTNLVGTIKCFFEFNEVLYLVLRPMKVCHDKMFYNLSSRTCIRHILPVIDQPVDNYVIIDISKIKSIDNLFNLWNEFLCRRPNVIISTVV